MVLTITQTLIPTSATMPPRLREQLDAAIASIHSAGKQVERSSAKSSTIAGFQDGLRTIIHGIQSNFNHYARSLGLPFEDGDYISNTALAACLRKIRDTIEPSLRDFCDGRGNPRSTEVSRLNNIVCEYKTIEGDAVDIMLELSFRIADKTTSKSNFILDSNASSSTTNPSPLASTSMSELRRALKTQVFHPPASLLARNPNLEPTISRNSYTSSSSSSSSSRLREMREHMQNSWTEVERHGSVLWINKWDTREERRTPPPQGAFICNKVREEEEEEEDEMARLEKEAWSWPVGGKDDGRERLEKVRRLQEMSPEQRELKRTFKPLWLLQSR